MSTPLKNRNAIITGASRGLGAALACAYWDKGANLFLVARSRRGLQDIVSRLSPKHGQTVHFLSADLADTKAPERIVKKAATVFDKLDILVNNAAIQGPIGRAWENDWAEWRTTIQINLLAPVRLCDVCIPWMAKNGCGKIINLSGGGAASSRPRFSAYATAKAGLVRFSETLAEETRGMGISVNCVAPGPLYTAMQAETITAGPEPAGEKEYKQALCLRDKNQGTERAASLCVFLASPESNGITGKLISAVWDPWESLKEHKEELSQTDIYTLRRIVPKDRKMTWGKR